MWRGKTTWRKQTGGLVGAAVLALCHWVTAQTAAPELPFDENDFKIPMWNTMFEVRGGLGYKDNVTLSSSETAEASGFWLSRAEVILFRLPARGWQFNFFATADDVRYSDAESVDNEQVAMAVAQLNKDFGHGWKSTLGLNYLFQNQVFDVSATYTNGGSIGLIRGHMLSPRWSTRKTIGSTWVELELAGTRQILEGDLDSYWTFGPRVTAGRSYGRGSEVALGYQWVWLAYDTREQTDLDGVPLTNTVLEVQTHIADLSWTHVWDESRHWQTTTRLGGEFNQDNGSGYYDYNVYRANQEARYRTATWEVVGRVGFGFYDYANQQVSTTDTTPRQRILFTAGVRAEKKLAKHFKVHASYDFDRSLSRLEFDDYLANVVLGGFAFEF